MHTGFLHLHSALRWVALILLVWGVLKFFSGWKNQRNFKGGDRKVALFGLITLHLQLIIGLVLYFTEKWPNSLAMEGAMKNPVTRFFGIEHLILMLLGIIAVTIGYSKAKRIIKDTAKFRTLFIWYAIGLALIIVGIPWPFREALGRGWF